MSDALLTSKGAPPTALLSAIALGLAIVGSMWWLVHELQEHHAHAMEGNHPVPMPLLTLAFPLSAMTVLALEIPLFMYVTDHAAFQSLNVLRPDHYGKCVATRAHPLHAATLCTSGASDSHRGRTCRAYQARVARLLRLDRSGRQARVQGDVALLEAVWPALLESRLAARGGPRARGRARRCARV